MTYLIKRFFQLTAYAILILVLLTSLGLMMVTSNEHQVYSSFTIAVSVLTIFSIIVWKKRKKLREAKFFNPFKSEDSEDDEPTPILKKLLLFPVYLGGGVAVLFGLFFVVFFMFFGFDIEKGDYDAIGGFSLFIVGLFSGYVFLPIIGIILEKRGKKHPHENFRKFIFAWTRLYLGEYGVIISVLIAVFFFALEWFFDIIFVITKAEWFLFYVLILPTSAFAVLLTVATLFFGFLRLFNKKIKPAKDYLKLSSKKAEGDNWSKLNTSLGYFGFSMFKIGAITFFLMCLFINHEFRIPAFVLSLLYLIPNFYIWFVAVRDKKLINVNKTETNLS